MKFKRSMWGIIFGLMCLCFLGLTTCSSNPERPDEKLIDGKRQPPEYLKYIPADTLYAWGGLEPLPEDHAMWRWADELTGAVQLNSPEMEQLRQMAASDGELGVGAWLINFYLEIIEAIRQGPNFRQAWANLGFTTRGFWTIYAVDLFPVLRWDIASKDKVTALLDRVETRSSVTSQRKTLGEVNYRVYPMDSDEQWSIVATVTDEHLVVGITHEAISASYLPVALGVEKPKKSLLKDNRFAAINKEFGFSRYSTGFFELARLLNALIGADSTSSIAKTLALVGFTPPTYTETCQREMQALINQWPRVVMGMPELSVSTLTTAVVFQSNAEWLPELAQTKAPIPGYGSDVFRASMAFLGVGMDMEKLKAFTLKRAQALANEPFQCEQVQAFSTSAQEATTAFTMVPPAVLGLRGASVMMRDLKFDFDGKDETSFEVAGALHAANPAELWGFVSVLSPELQSIRLVPNAPPTPLDIATLLAQVRELKQDMPAYLMMTDNGLGMSMGEGMEDEALAMLQTEVPSGSPMYALKFGFKRIMEAMKSTIVASVPPESEEDMQAMFDVFKAYEEMIMWMDILPNALVFGATVQFSAPAEPAGSTENLSQSK